MKAGRPFLIPLLSAALGLILFGLADAAIGLRDPAPAIAGAPGLLLYFVLAAGSAAAVGLAAGAVLAAWFAMLGRGRLAPAFSPAVLLLALAAAIGVLVANLGLFRGAGIRRSSWQPALEWGFRILAPLFVFAGVLLAARALEGRRARAAGAGLLVAGIALLLANRIYRNQYPGLHVQVTVAAAAAFAAGVSPFLRGRPATLVLPVLLVLAAAHAGRPSGLSQAYARADAAFASRADAVGRLQPWPSRLLRLAGKPAPERVPESTADALLARVAPQILDRTGAAAREGAALRRRALDDAAPKRRDWNVVWIAIDTVRADHTSLLGYGRKTTPALDALASESVVFEHAYTAYPTSNLGFCSALTSLAARATPVFAERLEQKPAFHELQALPALLAKAGRDTVAVTAFDRDDVADPAGFDRLRDGFALFNPDQSEAAADAGHVTRSALNALGGRLAGAKRPFFLWIHYLDPHDPYLHHADHDFGAEGIDRYDGEIAFADRHAGEVVGALRRAGRWNDTVLVVFSDHGEEFGEHGGRYHNGSVYDEQARVPLLVRIPGVPGRRVKAPASLLDLVPTIAELLDVEDPAPRHGRSLVPAILGAEDAGMAYSEVFVAARGGVTSGARAVVTGGKKLLRRMPEDRFELYDLDRDPAERTSLIGQGDPDEPVLRGVLAAWDRAIDGQAPDSRGETTAARAHALARLLEAPSDETARDAAARLDALLIDGYGGVRPEAAAAMTADEARELFDLLAAIEPRTNGNVPSHVVGLLAARGDPSHAPALRRVLGDPGRRGDTRLRAALALAGFDDPAGLPLLLDAARHPLILDKADVAWALVRLGDPSAIDWYAAVLGSMRFGPTLKRTLQALPKIRPLLARTPGFEDVPPARLVRDRFFEDPPRHRELDLALVSALRGSRDEDSMLVLVRLMRSEDESVRKAAGEALADVMTGPDLERNLAAMDDEMDADSARLNRELALAAAGYRLALAKGTLVNAGLRFRLAATLHEKGDVDGARQVLEEIAAVALLELDRKLARRRIGQLAWSRTANLSQWKCTVLEASVPSGVNPAMPFMASFRLRNDGKEPWLGGWSQDSVELHLRFEDERGMTRESPADANFVNHLTEDGVNPGEEVRVFVLGVGPPAGKRGPMTLSFRSPRTQYPNGGVVWRESRPASAPTSR